VAVPVQWHRGVLFPIDSKGTVSLLGFTSIRVYVDSVVAKSPNWLQDASLKCQQGAESAKPRAGPLVADRSMDPVLLKPAMELTDLQTIH